MWWHWEKTCLQTEPLLQGARDCRWLKHSFLEMEYIAQWLAIRNRFEEGIANDSHHLEDTIFKTRRQKQVIISVPYYNDFLYLLQFL